MYGENSEVVENPDLSATRFDQVPSISLSKYMDDAERSNDSIELQNLEAASGNTKQTGMDLNLASVAHFEN